MARAREMSVEEAPKEAGRSSLLTGVKRWAPPLVGLVLFAVGLGSLGHQLRAYHLKDVLAEVGSIPPWRVAAALVLSAFNYLVLVRYDVLALRYVGHPMPLRRIALASFVASSVSNNVGFSVLSGGSVRYRLYSAFGVPALDTTRIVAFVAASVWTGFFLVAGLSFLVASPRHAEAVPLEGGWVPLLGLALLLAWGAWAVLALLRRRPFLVRGVELAAPTPRMLAEQAGVAALDWLSMVGVLYLLLPAGAISFHAFAGAYLLALFAGLLSQVPGGLGVFESVLMLLLTPQVPPGSLAAALLAYRLAYYVLPLGAAVALLGGYEALSRREQLRRLSETMARWASPLAPGVVGIGVFCVGLVLLLSSASPGVHGRLRWLDDRLPLGVLEVSHLAGAVVGAQLLLLARGLQKRLRHAWALGVGLLAAGAVFSVLKGLDWEEALLSLGVLAALLPSRREFYREASLLQEPFEAAWIAAVALAMLSAVGLGLFAYKHVDYSHDLWLQFEVAGDASRFLRASAASLGVAAFFALAHLARPRQREPAGPTALDLERARAILAQSPETYGHLALLGDKSLLFDASGTAFVMFAREAQSFVAMGDPVGPEPARRELAWRFRELADRHAAHTVFYEAGEASLPIYLDLGLSLQKLGEEAVVPLEGFTLEGREKKGLRSACNRLEREGVQLEIVGPEAVPPLLPRLREVSDAWLSHKSTREKGFSMGFFDERYLSLLPVALLRRGGDVVAFANLWQSGGRQELSVDLMRFGPDAPPGSMDFLFARLMAWGREQGFARFNLGMAPFSGFEQHPLSPAWNRMAALLFQHGERFYNFQGLRAYKEKFGPVWRPRYLAAPRGFALPFVLANVAALVSRGLKGVVAR